MISSLTRNSPLAKDRTRMPLVSSRLSCTQQIPCLDVRGHRTRRHVAMPMARRGVSR
jgi:hypothetical protein